MPTADHPTDEQGSKSSNSSVSDPTEVERHAPSDGDVFRNEFAATDSYKVPNRIGQLWAIDWKKEEIPDNQDSEDDEDDGLQKRPPLDYGFMSDLLVNVLDGKFKEAVKFVADKSAQQLGLQYDKHQRTAAHYAAMRAEGAELLKKLVQKLGTSCLKHEDCNSVTPLQYAAQNYSLQQFNKLFPDAVQELRSSTHRNKLGDTLAHFAARNTGDEEVIKSVLHGNNPHRLLWRNNRGRTVLHEAVEHCSAETVKDLLEQAINHFISVILRGESNDSDHQGSSTTNGQQQEGKYETSTRLNLRDRVPTQVWEEVIEKMKNLKESDGSTLAHCASRNRNPNCKDGEVFRVVEKLFGDECLNWENSMYQTVLQAVIQYSTDSTTKEMVEVFAENNIDKFFTHTDESENGYLHSAARYKKKETFRKILELMKKPGVDKEKDECIKQICDKPNVDGQTVLHFAAERKDELSIVEEELSFDDWGEFIAKRDNRNRNILFYACMKWNFSAFELQSKKLDKSAFTEVDADGNSLLHAVFMNRNNDNGYSSLKFFKFLKFFADKTADGIRQENNMGKNFLHCSQINEEILINILTDAKKNNWEEKLKEVFLSKAGVHVVHEFACKYNLVKLMLPLSEIAGVKKAELRSKKVERGPYKGATCLHFACRTGHKSNIAYLVKKSLSIYARDDDGRTCVDYARSADQLKRLAEGTGKSELEFLRLLDPTRAALKLPDRTAAMQYISQIVDQSVIDEVERGQSQFKTEEQTDQANPSTDASSKLSTEVSVFKAVWKDGSTRALRRALKLDPSSLDTEAKFIRYWAKEHPSDVEKIDENEEEIRIVDLALRCNKLDLLPDLILTRQFELIPSCILLIIQLKQKMANTEECYNQLKRLKSKVISIAVNTLDHLYTNGNVEERQLLFNYIKSKIGGPKFSIADDVSSRALTCCSGEESQQAQQHTILELVEIAECEDLYATDCIYKLAEEEWKKSKICGSTRTHFAFSLAIYILFMLYFAWFITDFRRTFDSLASDVILTAFALLFFVLELIDLLSLPPNKILYCSSRRTKCSMYWRNVYNVFDFIALLLLWLGIVWKWVILGKSEYVTAYACQSVFSTSFLFFGFRSVEFLSSWQRTGAVIVILKNLIVKDLGPFLAIIAIVFLSFGVFFFNLLFPSITAEKSETRDTFYWWRVMLQIFTMPFDLLFTNYDRLEFDTPTSGSPQKVGSVTNAIGLSWFRNLTMFVFLLLVNIVMVNLLIALFSLRVSTLHSKAIGIWRQGYFELLLMYQRRAELCRSCVGRSASIYPDDNQDVVIDGKKYKKSYLRYLRYQAQQLRKIRPRLSQELEKNRSDFEQLKAHFENNMAQVQSETSEDLAHLQRKFKELEHAQNLSLQEILEILKRLPQQSQQEPETDQGRK
ncbi:hypothetical protein BOX15_Mlig005733g3 [Macrostomum lignano]|uniref:Ion transport domain-containing protein n=1 Tax=Macrostomum lignano TaxID=282301 RepID=A0A267DJ10_9PLAT|nr:hypothetical protein BOX15_Mlig005733g3 [Macrostomum lignano]